MNNDLLATCLLNDISPINWQKMVEPLLKNRHWKSSKDDDERRKQIIVHFWAKANALGSEIAGNLIDHYADSDWKPKNFAAIVGSHNTL